MISSTLTGLDRLILDLGIKPRQVEDAVVQTMNEQIELLEATVVDRMRSLFKTSARMEANLYTAVGIGEGVVTGSVNDAGLPWLRIQEYGGVTRPHDIFPVHAAVLAFMAPSALGFSGNATNQMVFAKGVHHPGSKMPERSYMRSALAMRRREIVAAFTEATQMAAAA